MRKFLVLGLLAVGFTAGGAAFACSTGSTCNAQPMSIQQNVNLTVPPMLMLVLDSNTSNTLNAWNVDLSNALGSGSNCYAIPNQVTTSGLNAFIKAAQGNGGLITTPAYPAVFSSNGQVQTWAEVVKEYAGNDSGSPYLQYASSPAKGNVVCGNPFVVEKWTNCPNGATFSMTLGPTTLPGSVTSTNTSGTTSAKTGYGAFEAMDSTALNGTPVGSPTNTGWITTADGTTMYNLSQIQPGNFYDDSVSQWLWLQSAQPGTYALQATYTLAETVPTTP